MSGSAPQTTDDYVALITPWQSTHPRFVATIAATVAPFAALQRFLAELPSLFDLDLAVGVQLDQVGLWIGLSRYVELPITGVYFTWDTVNLGWDQGVWQGPFDPSEGLSRMGDDIYRSALRAKALANRWDGTVRGAATALAQIFNNANTPGTNLLILDNQDMTMTFKLTGATCPPIFKGLLVQNVIDLVPMGVGFNVVDATTGSGPSLDFSKPGNSQYIPVI